MIVYGFHPVREALRHRPHEVERVLVGRGRKGGRRREIEELCRRHRVSCSAVGEEELRRLAAGVHNGFVAEIAAPAGRVEADPNLVVLLEDVQDPRNLGALLRVCEGAGAGRVVVRDRGSAPVSATVVKTSAGATEWLELERVVNTAQALEELRREGFWIYGAAQGGAAPWEVDLSGKVVICFGGEERGLRQRTRKLCDGLLTLPMRGRIESLNVATAAAAVLYEAVRQRVGAGGPVAGGADVLPPQSKSG